MVAQVPDIPEKVYWHDGMVLQPVHFRRTDDRAAGLAHVAGLLAEPWPWGFSGFRLDEVSLASHVLRIECQGIFPDGFPIERIERSLELAPGQDGATVSYHLQRNPETDEVVLQPGVGDAPGEQILPVARLAFRGGVWRQDAEWSPPALLIGTDHPLRADANRRLGALAALGAGFVATLRLPGAENRPVARVLGQVAVALAQGVGVIETLLAAPAVAPGRIGLEALRLALGVRSAAGIFEPIDGAWSHADQRGSIRRLLSAAEEAASGIGLPFRANVFHPGSQPGVHEVDIVAGSLLLAIEASRPADLIAARKWFDGAALAAPDRIQEALTRRVSGCPRRSVERDPVIGISSGPLLALYQVDDDIAWRGGQLRLALAAEAPMPQNTSFSILLVEGAESGGPALLPGPQGEPANEARSPPWAMRTDGDNRR